MPLDPAVCDECCPFERRLLHSSLPFEPGLTLRAALVPQAQFLRLRRARREVSLIRGQVMGPVPALIEVDVGLDLGPGGSAGVVFTLRELGLGVEVGGWVRHPPTQSRG